MEWFTRIPYCQIPHGFVSLKHGKCKKCKWIQIAVTNINLMMEENQELIQVTKVTWREFKKNKEEEELFGYGVTPAGGNCKLQIKIRKQDIFMNIGGLIFSFDKNSVDIEEFKISFNRDIFNNTAHIKSGSYIYLL